VRGYRGKKSLTLLAEYFVEKVGVQALGDEGLHIDLEVLLELGRLAPARPSDLPRGEYKHIQYTGEKGCPPGIQSADPTSTAYKR
jgi:hypothetical protein